MLQASIRDSRHVLKSCFGEFSRSSATNKEKRFFFKCVPNDRLSYKEIKRAPKHGLTCFWTPFWRPKKIQILRFFWLYFLTTFVAKSWRCLTDFEKIKIFLKLRQFVVQLLYNVWNALEERYCISNVTVRCHEKNPAHLRLREVLTNFCWGTWVTKKEKWFF